MSKTATIVNGGRPEVGKRPMKTQNTACIKTGIGARAIKGLWM